MCEMRRALDVGVSRSLLTAHACPLLAPRQADLKDDRLQQRGDHACGCPQDT